jgi:CheY-like chemotaxis protein
LLVREGAKSPVSKRKLLLADDSITIQKVVNLTFADEGIEVIAVGDGDAAMIKFNESMPDLVLADVNMPGLDGYRICEMIKQDDETKHIPVILLVGSFEPFDEQEAWRVGADDFLTKPFQSIRQLVTKVSDLLNAPAADSKTSAAETNVAIETEVENGWQYADTKELPAEEVKVENLGDTGMDDEMIQTDQVNEPAQIDEVQKFISDSYSYKDNETQDLADREDLTENSFKNEADEDFALLEPNTENELTRITDEEPETEPEIELETSAAEVDDFSDAEIQGETVEIVQEAESDVSSETIEEPETVEESQTNEDNNDSVDEAVAENNDSTDEAVAESETTSDWQIVSEDNATTEVLIEEEFEETEEVEEVEELKVSAETESIETKDSNETETTETEDSNSEDSNSEVVAETETADNTETEQPSASPKASVSFDDLNLLELPPLVEETGIRPHEKNQEIKTVAETIEPEAEVAETVAAVEAVETSEKADNSERISAQAFPPELIEAIAQKVAERISDKTIRDIAWEVVPQMTDLIVKKLAEEQLENKAKEMSD